MQEFAFVRIPIGEVSTELDKTLKVMRIALRIQPNSLNRKSHITIPPAEVYVDRAMQQTA